MTEKKAEDTVLERRRKRVLSYVERAELLKNKYKKKGLELEVFTSYKKVITGILTSSSVQNWDRKSINITELYKNKNSRFVALDNVYDSEQLSFILSKTYREGRQDGSKASFEAGYQAGLKTGYGKAVTLNEETIKRGQEKRIQNADEHAKKMFELIENMEDVKNSKSLREAAKMLNYQQIPTARGGSWYAQTLQDLYKRWEKLGLRSMPSPE